MAVSFANVNSEAGLKKLDEYLLTRSYITGYQASKDDLAVYSSFSAAPSSKYTNVARWFSHIDALLRLSGVTEDGQGVKVESSAVPEASTPDVADAKGYDDIPKEIADPDAKKVGHLEEQYQDWVHQPIVSKEGPRFFGNDVLELLTRTKWWAVPLIWLPVACWCLSDCIQMGHTITEVAIIISGDNSKPPRTSRCALPAIGVILLGVSTTP